MTEQDVAPPDYFELLRVLTGHDAEFVVIGGLAVILHGYERMTTNIDVVPEASPQNLERLRAALLEVEAVAEGMPVGGGDNWVLNTKLGRVDVMPSVAGVESYEELRANAVAAEIPQVGGTVWFAGLDDLIEMKREAGRDQDLIDITALRMAHGLEE